MQRAISYCFVLAGMISDCISYVIAGVELCLSCIGNVIGIRDFISGGINLGIGSEHIGYIFLLLKVFRGMLIISAQGHRVTRIVLFYEFRAGRVTQPKY